MSARTEREPLPRADDREEEEDQLKRRRSRRAGRSWQGRFLRVGAEQRKKRNVPRQTKTNAKLMQDAADVNFVPSRTAPHRESRSTSTEVCVYF